MDGKPKKPGKRDSQEGEEDPDVQSVSSGPSSDDDSFGEPRKRRKAGHVQALAGAKDALAKAGLRSMESFLGNPFDHIGRPQPPGSAPLPATLANTLAAQAATTQQHPAAQGTAIQSQHWTTMLRPGRVGPQIVHVQQHRPATTLQRGNPEGFIPLSQLHPPKGPPSSGLAQLVRQSDHQVRNPGQPQNPVLTVGTPHIHLARFNQTERAQFLRVGTASGDAPALQHVSPSLPAPLQAWASLDAR